MINIKINFRIQIDDNKFDRWRRARAIGKRFARNYIKEQIEIKTKQFIKENDLK